MKLRIGQGVRGLNQRIGKQGTDSGNPQQGPADDQAHPDCHEDGAPERAAIPCEPPQGLLQWALIIHVRVASPF